MKQVGKTWITPEGTTTESKWIPEYEKHCEAIGQKIAETAMGLESRIDSARTQIAKWVAEMLARHMAKEKVLTVKRFSFTTFDKGFKVEVDVQEQYYRVYKATKTNPGHKDYELIVMDFSKPKKEALKPLPELVPELALKGPYVSDIPLVIEKEEHPAPTKSFKFGEPQEAPMGNATQNEEFTPEGERPDLL